MPTTILLVDDHPVFRKGLRQLLEEEQDFKVVGEAGDGKEAIALVGKLSPDVVVMDINMPNFNGIEATRQIVSDFPETKIVALSIHSGKRFIEDMLRAGAVWLHPEGMCPRRADKRHKSRNTRRDLPQSFSHGNRRFGVREGRDRLAGFRRS